ncbi:hypothetical protein JW916_15560 [Candidatus Sumerlaeota bacterium]|nr:hypothetical protein [Candidatus Sumerlaeota bacterium]
MSRTLDPFKEKDDLAQKSVRGANAILALRSCYASGRFGQFWEDVA